MVTNSNLGNPVFGRLGNQLFAIASAIGIAKKNNLDFIFPEWSYSKYFKHHLPTGTIIGGNTFYQKGKNYQDIVLGQGDWDLVGFFQTEKFFKHTEALVRFFFEPTDEVAGYITSKYGDLLTNECCSLHVRRGDYTRFHYDFKLQPLAYYHKAIAHFNSKIKFLIFSDDIAWCKIHFIGDQYHFIEGEEDIIDLMIMSNCTHNIISNSSFSWWGAWLNKNSNKVVLCPAEWYGPRASLKPAKLSVDIYAEGFQKINLSNGPVIDKISNLINFTLFFYYHIKIPLRTVSVSILKNLRLKNAVKRLLGRQS